MRDNHGSEGRDKPAAGAAAADGARPLVSVIVPTFRRPDLLARALASVRAQSHRPLQVVVVDDDDDPATEGLAREALGGAAGLEAVFLRQKRRGAAAARNRGIAAATGVYLQFLDDDDELFPDKIAAQVAALEETGADVVHGDWRQGQDLPSARLLKGRETSNRFAHLAGEGWTPCFAYLARADVCRAAGGWREALRYNDDFDFFLRLAARGARFRYVPGESGFYRWHPGPRVSRAERARRVAANGGIIAEAEALRRAAGTLGRDDLVALLAFWRRLAGEAAREGTAFELCLENIGRLRGELGAAPGALEAAAPGLYYSLRRLGGPALWARRLAHAVLPLAARRAVRRWENGARAALR